MSNRVIVSTDSSCDIGPDLLAQYDIRYFPYHIILDTQEYLDGENITNQEIFDLYYEKKILPKTAAISTYEYLEYFKQFTDKGYEVVHIGLSSAMSGTFNNCLLAAKELPGVHIVDSKSLSSGVALLVLEAAKRAEAGLTAAEIAEEITALVHTVHASFVIDTLEFMRAGGRCSGFTALAANLLNVKPCIEVNSNTGIMTIGRKYRGTIDKVLIKYISDKLHSKKNILPDTLFIASPDASKETLAHVTAVIKKELPFEHIYFATASCTISCHCGPGTLGIFFMTKD